MAKKLKTYEDGREYEIHQMVRVFVKAPPSLKLLVKEIFEYLSKRQDEILTKIKK